MANSCKATPHFLSSFLPAFTATIVECSNCGRKGDDWCEEVRMPEGDVYKICKGKGCLKMHGFDDTTEIDQLERRISDQLTKAGLTSCECGNHAMHEFEVDQEYIECKVCQRRKYVCGDNHEDGGWSVFCLKCKNMNPEWMYFHEYNGKPVGIECFKCGHLEGEIATESGTTSTYEKELIKDYTKLRPGDHIAWCRAFLGHYHHALIMDIVRSGEKSCRVQVAEYGSNKFKEGRSGIPINVVVRLHDVDLEKESGNLFRYNYESVYDAHTAMIRAGTALGKKAYSVLSNNCEHFVRWCKTGINFSKQENIVKNKLRELGSLFGKYISPKNIGKAIGGAVGPAIAQDVAVEAGTEIGEFVFKHSGNAFEVLGLVVVTALEAYNIYGCCKKNRKDFDEGKIDRHEYVNCNVRDVSVCVVRGAGAVAGGILGEMAGKGIAAALVLTGFLGGGVGILAAVVGGLVGAFAGAFLGQQIGHRITYVRDKNYTPKDK